MTEREYVEAIRKTAHAYLSHIGAGSAGLTAELWYQTKLQLSPHTAIALCDAWLTMQETVE